MVWALLFFKGPILYTFLEFILGFSVLNNIYLWYKYQKYAQYVCTVLFSGALLKTDRFVLSN